MSDWTQYERTYNALLQQEMRRCLERKEHAELRLNAGRGDDDDQACVDVYGSLYDALQRMRLT